jgi:hypothetical protein
MSDTTRTTPGRTKVPPTWAQLVEAERIRPREGHPNGMGNNEFARFLEHPQIKGDVVARWRKGVYGASPELVIHFAARCGLPASLALRAARHEGLASYVEGVTGGTSTGAAALEPLVAQVRKVTDGLTETEKEALVEEMLARVGDVTAIIKLKAEEMRRSRGTDTSPDEDRDAS